MKPRLLKNAPQKGQEPRSHAAINQGSADKVRLPPEAAPSEGFLKLHCSICRIATTCPHQYNSNWSVPSTSFRHISKTSEQGMTPKSMRSVADTQLDNSRSRRDVLQMLSARLLRRTVPGCSEHYSRIIDNILEQKQSKEALDHNEIKCELDQERLSRYYKAYEFPSKLQILYRFCKFVLVFPKLYNLTNYRIIRRHIHMKRRKRERTMRRILDEIDESNMHMLSLDYVLVREGTCAPVDLKKFTLTKLAVKKTHHLGLACLGSSESLSKMRSGQQVYAACEDTNETFPFEVEESTILGANRMARDNNSFGDSALLGDGGQHRFHKEPTLSSFALRKGDLKLPMPARKLVRNVYSNYKRHDFEAKRPSLFGKEERVCLYERKALQKKSYRTRSDNEMNHLNSTRGGRVKESSRKPGIRTQSEREVMVIPFKYPLGTNKLVLSSTRTIQTKKPLKLTLTPAGEFENQKAQGEVQNKWTPVVVANIGISKKHTSSFKKEPAQAPLTKSDSSQRSSLYNAPIHVSDRSVKMPFFLQKRTGVNKNSVEEYHVKQRKGRLGLASRRDSGCESTTQVGTRPTLDEQPQESPTHEPSGSPTAGSALIKTKPVAICEPPITRTSGDVLPPDPRSGHSPPEDKLTTLLKRKPFLKQGGVTKNSKVPRANLKSVFQMAARRELLDQHKKSFAHKDTPKTYCDMVEVDACAPDYGQVREDRPKDGRSHLSGLLRTLLFRKH